jgi:hypothetical protein
MKKLMFLASAALIFASCNSNSGNTKEQDSKAKSSMTGMNTNTATLDDKGLKVTKPSFASVDAGVSSSMGKLVADYLKIKDALAADDADGASAAAGSMSADLKATDKSKFTADQKTFYEKDEDDLKENAEHINAKKVIDHQREHFGMMTEDFTDLVKAFGSNAPLYNFHCSTGNDKDGSNWLSETKQIKNPYTGKQNTSCGDVVEVFEK